MRFPRYAQPMLVLGLLCAYLTSCGPVAPVSADRFTYEPGRTYGVFEVVGQTTLAGGYVLIFCPIADRHVGVQFAGHCTLSPGGAETPWATLESWQMYAAGSQRYIIAEFKQTGSIPTFATGSAEPQDFGFLMARFGQRAYAEDPLPTLALTAGKVHLLGQFDLANFRNDGVSPVRIGNDAALEDAFKLAFPAITEDLIDRPTITQVPAACARTDDLIAGTGWNCVLQR